MWAAHHHVYHAEKVSGLTSQKVTIHYNCIGKFEVPSLKDIAEMDITIKTRKGVALCYSQYEKAV